MNNTEEQVILVDEQDQEVGYLGKWEAHIHGHLHRAVSVVVFNSEGLMLLQQRAFSKYHTPGLWSNTCCSHPRPGEPVEAASSRRLMEEMGFSTILHKKLVFRYIAHFDNGLTEHEIDHLFIGTYDSDPVINPEEVAAFAWKKPAEILHDMEQHPEVYTAWFIIIMKKISENFPELIKN